MAMSCYRANPSGDVVNNGNDFAGCPLVVCFSQAIACCKTSAASPTNQRGRLPSRASGAELNPPHALVSLARLSIPGISKIQSHHHVSGWQIPVPASAESR